MAQAADLRWTLYGGETYTPSELVYDAAAVSAEEGEDTEVVAALRELAEALRTEERRIGWGVPL